MPRIGAVSSQSYGEERALPAAGGRGLEVERAGSAVDGGRNEHQGFQLVASVGALLGKLLSHERKVLGSRMCGETRGL